MTWRPFLRNEDYDNLKSMLGKVVRTAFFCSDLRIVSPGRYDGWIVTLGLTQKEWTHFNWVSIRPRLDKQMTEEYLFEISGLREPVFLPIVSSVKYPNGWTLENNASNSTFILECWPIHPVTKIKLYKTDAFDGIIVFEHHDNKGDLLMKWCITSSYDSAKPMTIFFPENGSQVAEADEIEGLLEIS